MKLKDLPVGALFSGNTGIFMKIETGTIVIVPVSKAGVSAAKRGETGGWWGDSEVTPVMATLTYSTESTTVQL